MLVVLSGMCKGNYDTDSASKELREFTWKWQNNIPNAREIQRKV